MLERREFALDGGAVYVELHTEIFQADAENAHQTYDVYTALVYQR